MTAALEIAETARPPPAPAAGASGPWIVGPGWDALVCLSTIWFPIVAWALFRTSEGLGLAPTEATVIAFVVAVNLPHFLTTFTFTYLDPGQRAYYRRHPIAYYAIPLALIVGGWAYSAFVGPLVLVTAWFLFAEHHVAAQNIGFAALYRQRNREGEIDRKLDHLIFNTAWLATVTMYATRAPGTKGLQYFSQPTYSIPFADRDFVVSLFVIVSAGALVAYLLRQVQRWWRGMPVSVPKLLFMLTTWPSFLAVPFLVRDAELAMVIRSGYHGIQYLGLVYLLNERRTAARAPSAGDRALRWLLRRGPAGYLGVHAAVALGIWWITEIVGHGSGFASQLGLPYLFYPGVALAHFFLDGLTWRFSDEHGRRTVLSYLRPPGRASPGAPRVAA